ncbi:MAG TPA: putative molybdenum carrier protein [Gammaproteobacteria bacterium]|nr:putative molybdenum carrier protein [Gammaproteobacteria bacterium]
MQRGKSSLLPTKIVSGGQTGVDRAALNTAIRLGIDHGGWCPRGRGAEDGMINERYRLNETDSSDYSERTRLNVRDSDGTLILTRGSLTGGTALTAEVAREYNKPLLILSLEKPPASRSFAEWIEHHRIKCLNVAGPRASKEPGVEKQAEKYLAGLLNSPDQEAVQAR